MMNSEKMVKVICGMIKSKNGHDVFGGAIKNIFSRVREVSNLKLIQIN